MDIEKKICCNEGVPLNPETTADIFLNTAKISTVTSTGTIIHLKTGDSSAKQDVGLHINTSYTKDSSRRIKLLFIINFILCALCIVISVAVAFCYWKEMITMKTQLNLIREQLLIESEYEERPKQLLPISKQQRKYTKSVPNNDDGITAEARRYYVENLGEEPLIFVDKKQENISKTNDTESSPFGTKGATIMHFIGTAEDVTMDKDSVIGPWVLDKTISSSDAFANIKLSPDYKMFQVVQSGVYFMYSQISYNSHTPNYYSIVASKLPDRPRPLVTCSSADVYAKRSQSKSQLTCATQTMVRLNAGEMISISLRETNIKVLLAPYYSFFGLVKLGA